jgi:Iron-containing redox enzyme
MSTTVSGNMLETLASNPVKQELVAYLKELKTASGTLPRDQILLILGQWFHPLHYFPTFLSRLISVTPHIEGQTFISRILWQELGEGDPARAHEKVYITTILDHGFEDPQQVTGAAPFEATARLVGGYEASSHDYLSGLGFLYGTEVVDLPMVATVGELMRRCTGHRDLPWVNIHVAQEPDHVESSHQALTNSFAPAEAAKIVEEAEQLWRLWIAFFKEIGARVLPRAAATV